MSHAEDIKSGPLPDIDTLESSPIGVTIIILQSSGHNYGTS